MTKAGRLNAVVIGGAVLLVAGVVAIVWLIWGRSIAVIANPANVGTAHSVASSSMAPTLGIGEQFFAVRMDATHARRGAVILLSKGKEQWLSRIVGLPGDTVEMRDGIVWLNGKAVAQRYVGSGPVIPDESGYGPSKMFRESFPGEGGSHRILDYGLGPADNAGPFVVPAGNLFVMGDNRDNAADSRYPADYAIGMLLIENVLGEVKTVYGSPDSKRIGQPIDRPAGNAKR